MRLFNATADRGAAMVAAAMWLVVVAALALGIGRVGGAVIMSARAASAADAVALAGAAADDAAAERAARRNDALIVSTIRDDRAFQVRVRVGSAFGLARAVRTRAADCSRPLDCHSMQ